MSRSNIPSGCARAGMTSKSAHRAAPRRKRWASPSLPSTLAGFDIVHLHYPFYGGAEPVAHARSSGQIRALVVTYHMDATASGLKGTVFDVHRETVQPWILSHADKLLVSSRDYAAASALARVEGALDQVHVCPFGVDLDRFHPGAEPALRTSLNIDGLSPVILFVGSLDAAHRFKGLDLLFTALTRLLHLSWHLVVVGDGDDRARFEREAADRGLAFEPSLSVTSATNCCPATIVWPTSTCCRQRAVPRRSVW